jgi:hypothetical protein
VDVGDALVKAAQPDLAFRAFAMGLEISEEPKALHRLAELSAAGRQWDAARRFWERSLTLDPEQPAVRGRLRELEDLRRR